MNPKLLHIIQRGVFSICILAACSVIPFGASSNPIPHPPRPVIGEPHGPQKDPLGDIYKKLFHHDLHTDTVDTLGEFLDDFAPPSQKQPEQGKSPHLNNEQTLVLVNYLLKKCTLEGVPQGELEGFQKIAHNITDSRPYRYPGLAGKLSDLKNAVIRGCVTQATH